MPGDDDDEKRRYSGASRPLKTVPNSAGRNSQEAASFLVVSPEMQQISGMTLRDTQCTPPNLVAIEERKRESEKTEP